MNEKDKKKEKEAMRKIIKEAAEIEIAQHDEDKVLTDEDMISSGQELPCDDMLDKIKKALKNTQN